MIVNKLKMCCNNCEHLALDNDSEYINWNRRTAYTKTTIFCKHYGVCKRYIECEDEPNETIRNLCDVIIDRSCSIMDNREMVKTDTDVIFKAAETIQKMVEK